MAAACVNDVCLQPEVLSRDALISTFKLRHIMENDVDAMDKVQLVDLYNTHVLPLPQRVNCDCKRWRRIYDKWMKSEKLHPSCDPDTKQINTKINGICAHHQIHESASRETSGTHDRLKPVPTSDGLNRKVCLNRKRSTPEKAQTSQIEVTLLPKNTTIDESPPKKHKPAHSDPERTKLRRQPITWP